ncbi:MAG: sulfite exporter TauE/SafE family protein [Methanomicrobium sp.]|nr:sulfite exporter TauE/SafE family protein [Methanomicrobium sp.]
MIDDSEILSYIILIISGVAAGIFSGIIGMGGGTILVPVQYNLLFNIYSINPDIAIRTAIATSLAVTLPTAISSTYGHFRHGIKVPKIGIVTSICGFTGGIAGGIISSHLSFSILAPFFAFVMFAMAVIMIKSGPAKDSDQYRSEIYIYVFIGFFVGILSAMIGIGGGVILAPLLIIFCKIPLKISSAITSLFVIGVSIGGLLPYTLMGGNRLLNQFITIGYLNVTWWIIIAVSSVIFARVGVLILYRFNTKYVRYLFILLLMYLSLNLLGII